MTTRAAGRQSIDSYYGEAPVIEVEANMLPWSGLPAMSEPDVPLYLLWEPAMEWTNAIEANEQDTDEEVPEDDDDEDLDDDLDDEEDDDDELDDEDGDDEDNHEWEVVGDDDDEESEKEQQDDEK
jgi:hypothetical protein